MVGYKLKTSGSRQVEKFAFIMTLQCSYCYPCFDGNSYSCATIEEMNNYCLDYIRHYNYTSRQEISYGKEWDYTMHRLIGKKRIGKKWILRYRCSRCGVVTEIGSSHRNVNIIH